MLEQLKYKNHLGEVFEFGKDGIFVDKGTLRDYQWTVKKKGNRIGALTTAVNNRTLPVVIFCKSEEEGIAARNRLHEVVEKDVLAMQYGKIIIGDFYFRCYVTKSQKKNYLNSKRVMQVTLTLTTDQPQWVRENKFSFLFGQGERVEGQNLDHPYDFPCDYAFVPGENKVYNPSIAGAEFQMVIYGACDCPTVYIGNHAYTVNCTVGENEYLTIDSQTKKIYITHNNGETTNVFRHRDRVSYIFEKIPAGNTTVSWTGDFGVDITLFEERSEPKWI